MERKRDKNGRFAKKEHTEKKELTSKEYEAKIAELEEKIECFSIIASDARVETSLWKSKYYAEKEFLEKVKELGKNRYEAIEWLLGKVPFWTRNKFWQIFRKI